MEEIKKIYYYRNEIAVMLNVCYRTFLRRIKKAGLQEYRRFTKEQIIEHFKNKLD
jgi:CRP-like cAMP-binding protein